MGSIASRTRGASRMRMPTRTRGARAVPASVTPAAALARHLLFLGSPGTRALCVASRAARAAAGWRARASTGDGDQRRAAARQKYASGAYCAPAPLPRLVRRARCTSTEPSADVRRATSGTRQGSQERMRVRVVFPNAHSQMLIPKYPSARLGPRASSRPALANILVHWRSDNGTAPAASSTEARHNIIGPGRMLPCPAGQCDAALFVARRPPQLVHLESRDRARPVWVYSHRGLSKLKGPCFSHLPPRAPGRCRRAPDSEAPADTSSPDVQMCLVCACGACALCITPRAVARGRLGTSGGPCVPQVPRRARVSAARDARAARQLPEPSGLQPACRGKARGPRAFPEGGIPPRCSSLARRCLALSPPRRPGQGRRSL